MKTRNVTFIEGKDFWKDGILYKRVRVGPFYRLTVVWQSALWLIGIAWHNRYEDECTRDFNCCNKIGRKSWWRINKTK